MTMPGSSRPEGAWDKPNDQKNQNWDDASLRKHLSNGAVGKNGTWDIAQKRFRVDGIPLEEQLKKINDHEQTMKDIVEAVEQILFQGKAWKYEGGEADWIKPEGLISIDVVVIGGGGGGAAAKWDIGQLATVGGGAGGGGGAIYGSIPANVLPASVHLNIGKGGAGGVNTRDPGSGGEDTTFGDFLRAGGGVGGLCGDRYESITGMRGTTSIGGPGGAGMIPGGEGGSWVFHPTTVYPPENGGNSTFGGELRGGGGGGGAGAGRQAGQFGAWGGIGGVSRGGTAGQTGESPHEMISAGGGGGGGGNPMSHGGNGGYPGGGGGGGGGGRLANNYGRGGNGAWGIAFVLERFS